MWLKLAFWVVVSQQIAGGFQALHAQLHERCCLREFLRLQRLQRSAIHVQCHARNHVPARFQARDAGLCCAATRQIGLPAQHSHLPEFTIGLICEKVQHFCAAGPKLAQLLKYLEFGAGENISIDCSTRAFIWHGC